LELPAWRQISEGGMTPCSTDLSAAVKVAADQGKCFDQAMTEIKLPKYEKWGSYAQYLPGNIQRFCEYWGGGY
jgi:hypothetical protein